MPVLLSSAVRSADGTSDAISLPHAIRSAAFQLSVTALSVVNGFAKTDVRVATTAAGTLASSFENGDSIDGVTLATGNRILIKNQAAGAENGIYTVNASGAPTRATDFDTADEMQQGAYCLVTAGSTNIGKTFAHTTAGVITVGSTALTFAEFVGTLDVYLQHSVDYGSTWDDFVHFTQVAWEGGVKRLVAHWQGQVATVAPLHAATDGTLAAGVVHGPLGDLMRVKWVVVDTFTPPNAGFTLKLDWQPRT